MADASALAVASNVCGNVVDRALNPVFNPITAMLRWKKNVKTLEDELEKLKDKRKTVQRKMDAALRKGQEIQPRVEKWMSDANKYIDDEEKKKSMEELVREATVKKCCFGWCPNPKSRYNLSKRAEEDALAVAGLVNDCQFQNVGNLPPDPKEVVVAPDKGFENFESRMGVLEDIMNALQNRSINRIGVHGVAGVGKRMLVKEVKRKAENFFDAVVMASVTMKQNLEDIQEQIARDLDLELDAGISRRVAADLIMRKLRSKKRVLVILVDIWKKIELEEVGIPDRDWQKHPIERNREEKEVAIPYGNEYKPPGGRKEEEDSSVEEQQCKILITSTDREVLLSYMSDADRIIKVNQLEYPEALKLFMKIVGKNVERAPDLLPMALEIVQECGGLPLAITTLGDALRTKTSSDEWSDALRQLKSHNSSAKVNSAIEFNFKQLEELKKTFFLCSLLCCNASIEDLLKYAVGLDLFHNVHSIQEARRQAITLINELKLSSLLVDGRNNMHFNVNNLVCDFATSIASRDHGVLVLRDGNTPEEFSDLEAMQKLRWICSSCVDISQLENLELALANNPQSGYQQLELFHLSDLSVALPGNLFRRMENLKVLDLTKMYLSPMPSSISHLKTLCTLRLDQSTLGISDVAAIGALRNLQVLSLVGCDIEKLPKEIAKLDRLKLFDLTDCAKLKVIPPDVIASLSRLEELKMGNSFDRWEVKQHENQNNASLDELLKLQNLTVLEVRICDAQMIPSDLFSEKLERYKIFIGDVGNDWTSSFESTKVLKLKMKPGFVFNNPFQKSLKMTELHMEDSFGVNVVDELDYKGFQALKYLYILHDQNIQQISMCSVTTTPNTFPNLEVLSLQKLTKLEKIFQGRFRGTSFNNLRVITVGLCNQLKNLFSSSITRQLHQLQEITVTNCRSIEEIVYDEEQGNKTEVEVTKNVELDQLRCLKLQHLPQLISFCRERNSASSSRAIPIFIEKVMFVKIEELQLSWINVNSIWRTSVASTSVNNLTKLIIVGCKKLEYIFSSSMARGLLKLAHLEIRDCKSLNEVIFTDNVEERDNLIFARLKFLQIKDLQNLIGFYSGSCVIKFQSMKVLSIENCPKLKGFIVTADGVGSTQHLFNEQVAFPMLERMTISHLKKLESIWQKQLFEDSFCKLKILRVAFCENLWTLFPSNHMPERFWKSLEELNIVGCGSLKVVFELGGIIKSDAAIVSELRILEIQSLARLKYILTKDCQEIISFEKLVSVLAYNCPSLKNLFPASVARRLLKLQKLWIESCGVEEIAATEGRGTKEVIRFEFPQVSCLELGNLPRLRYFYPEKHTTKWPRLKKFYFNQEGGVKKTTWQGQLEFPVQQPLFSVEEMIPSLEKLSLTREDIAMICKGQFREDLFYKIKVLHIQGYYEDESDILLTSFLNRFRNLKKLVANNFNGLFHAKELEDVSLQPFPIANVLFPSSQGDVENQDKHIEELRLKHIWGQDTTVLQNLETLKVWQCDGLINLSTLPTSCWNLTTLDVWNCQRMENLFSVSASKNLVQLKRMTVRQCYMLTAIVGNEVDGTEDLVINFLNLGYLKLECLTRLARFCSGKFIFKFPSLEQLIVNQCPELEIFCGSAPNTPSLKLVQSIGGEDRQFWEANLNTTIQQMYTKKVGYAGLKHLRLTDFPELLRKWPGSPHETLDFRLLQSLEICGCSNLKHLLTPSMVLDLVQLWELKVINCSTMDRVIEGDLTKDQVIEGDPKTNKLIFPLLHSIHLESCSNLTKFYVGSCKLELPSLATIMVARCPKMATFTSTFVGEQEKEASRYFFDNMVEFSNLELLKFSSSNIQEIWHNSLPELFSFVQNLTKLIVHGCDNLKYLFTSSMVVSFVQLNQLEICCCTMMEIVIVSERLAEKEKMCGPLFPRLDTLQLEDLPKLAGFCSANYTKFSCLTQLKISKCPVLKTFISSTATGDMAANQNYTPSLFDEKASFPSLERLTIILLGSLNKIWHNQLDVDTFPQLSYLSVDSCGKLLTIFPFSMWKRLQKLDTLLIQQCHSLKEIFEADQGSSAGQAQALLATQPTSNGDTAEFAFSKLTDLKLYYLPNLKCFCPKVHSIEFSSLRKLEVYGCSEIQMFASEFQSFASGMAGDYQLEIQIPRPLFWVDKATFLSLEQLKLEWNVIMKEIWDGEYLGECLPNLKVLELIHFHEQSVVLSSFIQSLPKLEKLVVNDASLDKIFHYEALGDEERTTHLLSKLLRYLWKEDSQYEPVFLNNLTILKVHECSKLKNLVPTLVYFENLQILEVSKCQGLTNLVRYSTAKRLVQLTRMAISHCDMIGEVVTCLDDEVKDGIEFRRLKCLQLCGLPRLSSFCSVKCKLVFPILEEVIVMECPKMKIFSRGKLETPKLKKVSLTGDRWLSKCDLNSTIQKSSTKKLIMSDNLKLFIFSLFGTVVSHGAAASGVWMMECFWLGDIALSRFLDAKQLLCLQEIKVTDCSNIVDVDVEEEDANDITARATDDVIELAAQIQCLRLKHLQ
ncbi:hypothetical protein SLA2020_076350 [Shorea laevis]